MRPKIRTLAPRRRRTPTFRSNHADERGGESLPVSPSARTTPTRRRCTSISTVVAGGPRSIARLPAEVTQRINNIIGNRLRTGSPLPWMAMAEGNWSNPSLHRFGQVPPDLRKQRSLIALTVLPWTIYTLSVHLPSGKACKLLTMHPRFETASMRSQRSRHAHRLDVEFEQSR